MPLDVEQHSHPRPALFATAQVTKIGKGGKLHRRSHLAPSELSVEELTHVLVSMPPGETATELVNTSFGHLDSSALAALLKDLAKLGHIKRAVEIFDHLRGLDAQQPMAALCDVYTYTTMCAARAPPATVMQFQCNVSFLPGGRLAPACTAAAAGRPGACRLQCSLGTCCGSARPLALCRGCLRTPTAPFRRLRNYTAPPQHHTNANCRDQPC